MEYEYKGSPASVRVVPWHIETFRIRLLSWNIDGLDLKELKNRTIGICEKILREDPHVVFLQEVIPETEKIIEELCPMYEMITSDDEAYYVAVLLKKDVVEIEDNEIVPYPNSVQLRSLLLVKCTIKGEKIVLMTSHLESCKAQSDERKEQLKICFSECLNAENDRTVIFGGDLNLRDYEVKDVGIPKEMFDLWEENGEDPDTKFTWDMLYNDNLDHFHPFKPRLRFDRIYMRYSNPVVIKLEHFELVGFGKLPDCKRFCSDHWAILAHFNITARVPYYDKKKEIE